MHLADPFIQSDIQKYSSVSLQRGVKGGDDYRVPRLTSNLLELSLMLIQENERKKITHCS